MMPDLALERLEERLRRVEARFPLNALRPLALDGHAHWGYASLAAATSDLTLGSSNADVAGATLTLTLANVDYLVNVVADIEFTVAPAGLVNAIAVLTDSGNTEIDSPRAAIFSVNATTGRATVAQQWIVRPTEPSYVIKVRGRRDSALGTVVIHSTHTTLRAWARIAP